MDQQQMHGEIETRDQMAQELRVSEPTREVYESVCARYDVICLTDDELVQRAYGIHYGDYSGRQALAQMAQQFRLAQVERERAEERKERASRRAVSLATCERCGQQMSSLLLMASSVDGNVCPQCYDEVER